jgi:hypothetical protein
MLKGNIMARVIFSITHEFDNGESSTTTSNTGSLTASEASAMEQYWTRKVAEGLLRMGQFVAASRDPEFAKIMADLTAIMEGKSPASA